MAQSAIDQATRLDEIGFAEFTSQLIGETFDALISANIRQQETYLTMVKEASKSLSDYINQTKDDISMTELIQFVSSLPSPTAVNTPRFKVGYKLSEEDAAALNNSIKIDDTKVTQPIFAKDEILNKAPNGTGKWDILLEAVAKRIAANKYDMLKTILRQGMLRLVVENGYLETRLTFNTWEYHRDTQTTSDYTRELTKSGSASGILTTIFSGPSVSSNRKLSVKTANTSNTDTSGTNISVFGGVKLQFKTDYLPLNIEI